MANDFEVTVDVQAPATATWTLAGDPGRIDEWFGAVESVTLDGDVRTALMKGGARLVERIVDRDEERRTYSYEVIDGIPHIITHRATITVDETPHGSRVRWRQTVTSRDEAYDAERRLAGVMLAGLESLRDVIEGTRSQR